MDHLIERYLAGHLSDAEADAFEQSLEGNPALARDIERIARMKTGFAVLERRGELADLLKAHEAPRTHRKAWLAAAAVAVFALGFLAFRDTQVRAPMLLAGSLSALSRHSDSPVPLRASVALARARGMGADAELESSGSKPAAAELEIATGAAPGTAYSAELIAVRAGGGSPVGTAGKLAANADGVVSLFLALHALPPGAYLLRLTPADASAPLEYSLAVRPATESGR